MKKLLALLTLSLGLAFQGLLFAADPSAVLIFSGSTDDKSFNESAKRGLDDLKATGWRTELVEVSRDPADWGRAMNRLATAGGWDLIILNGFDFSESARDVVGKFPEQAFVLYDSQLESGSYPNVYAISYRQNEAAYVAGVLAALVTKSDMKGANPENLIGFIGGRKNPVIDDFAVGFIEGARSVSNDIKVMVTYLDDWDDAARGKEAALDQYKRGADVVFPAAGRAGLGCVEAAKELGRYIIGVDSDQAMLLKDGDPAAAEIILTSVLKNIDLSLERAGEMFLAGRLPLGEVESLGFAKDGVDIARNDYYEKNVPSAIRDRVGAVRLEVADGRIGVPTALGAPDDEIKQIIEAVKP